MQTILGVFDNYESADHALATLEQMGFGVQHMDVSVKAESLVGDKGGSTQKTTTVSGATAGIVIGGLSGLLLGLAAVSIPGIGITSVTDPIAAAIGMSGMVGAILATAVLGALAGAALGALLNLSANTNSMYEQQTGHAVLLAVPATIGEQADRVREIFAQYHAEQIRSLNLTSGLSQG